MIFNKHDGTMILLLSDPACENYEVITCRNTGPGSERNQPNPGSFTFVESKNERRRFWEEPEGEGGAKVLSLSLKDVNKAMEIVTAHEMADPEAIKALREQVLENPQMGEVELIYRLPGGRGSSAMAQPQTSSRPFLGNGLSRASKGGNKNRADGLSRVNKDSLDQESTEDTPPVDGILDQEEDVRLHINKWSLRVPNCVSQPIWIAPRGYEQKADLVLKPFQEEDPWGGKDVHWMMKLALAGTHDLVEEVRTIEEGPTQVEEHEQLMGGMYLLMNTLQQGDFDRKTSLSPVEGEDLVPESQDDEFEEGEIKEAFRAEEYDGIYLELEIHEQRDRMEAAGISPTPLADPKISEQRIDELWARYEGPREAARQRSQEAGQAGERADEAIEIGELGFSAARRAIERVDRRIRQAATTSFQRYTLLSDKLAFRKGEVEQLTAQLAEEKTENKAWRTRLEVKEAEWKKGLKEMSAAVERLSATKVVDWTEQSRYGIQGEGMQGLFDQGEAAETS
ncbi:hypothetical protein CBR_g17018 [Chara braunii]|uniref:Uncharacterized protein n=1 Tax=Chara braunii TaxID=69332 RepID=A0A388KUE5_CHABU|nr:hypothetical protein CBR_g17018 [Chara braunii]|eukprot:GBG73676.1 hypothetical protein CBR_g17018 [Chara braunii]